MTKFELDKKEEDIKIGHMFKEAQCHYCYGRFPKESLLNATEKSGLLTYICPTCNDLRQKLENIKTVTK